MKQNGSSVNDLRAIRNRFGRDLEKRKQAAIADLLAAPLGGVRALMRLHDDLLFIRAFPGDLETARLSLAALRQFEQWVARLRKSDLKVLDDSGVAGSTTRHVYGFPIADWLSRHAKGDTEFDWRSIDDPSLLDPLIRAFTRRSELDAFDSGDYSTRDWVRLARGNHAPSDLHWMVSAAKAVNLKTSAVDEIWATAEPPIEWRLKGSRWSTTRNFLPGAPVLPRSSFRRPPDDITRRIVKPMKTIVLLPRAQARRVIETARTALAARCREVVAITYPNADEVYWCDLGHGAALAVILVAPSHRLSLETNTGYLLLSNGVPIGYGGVTPLFRQANTGINIFDAFRGGETAFLWVEMLRAFQSLFGSRRFIVNGYQFGEGNSEAIKSGAYWFYYRLGFRPNDDKRKRLAAREFSRLRQPGAARSSKATLKALATGDLILDLPGFDERDAFDETQLATVSALASASLAAAPMAGRGAAEQWIAASVAKALGVRPTKTWPKQERDAFAALAPVVSIAPDIAGWTAAEKGAVVRMMRAKGGTLERSFALAATDCPELFRSLAKAKI